MSNVSVLHEISNQANAMEDEGIVDITIVENLKKLQSISRELESKWVRTNTENSFYFYNAIKSVELILEKMIDRFLKAKEMHDNPQVAVDTVRLVPSLVDVIEITDDDKVDQETTDRIIERTYLLRNKAAETNLLESEEMDLEGVNKQKLLDTLNGMAKQFDVPEELPDDVTVNDENVS